MRHRLPSILGLFLLTTIAHADVLLEDLDGATIALSSLKGKWVFINYWASWCEPCIDEVAEFNRFYEQNKSNQLAIFAVNFDGRSIREQRDLAKRFFIHYPSLSRKSLSSLKLGDISVVPVTFVLNPAGQLSTTLYGAQTIESLKHAME